MKLKGGDEKIKELSDSVKKAEEINEWGWCVLFIFSDYCFPVSY